MPSRRESVTQFFRCVRVGYIGEGAFVARERGISASPMTISLVTFLFGYKKVTYIIYCIEEKILRQMSEDFWILSTCRRPGLQQLP